MVADTVRRGSSADGLQRLRLARDWRQVIALIEVAFGKELDAEAKRALHSMQLPPLLGPLIAMLDSLAAPGSGMMPGFVWREGGRVMGTASVRRIRTWGNGWLISNVAVHPDRQGQGIGRALLEASLDYAQDFGASWVVLQVRDNNTVARHLYDSLGFISVGEVVRLRKPGASAEQNSHRLHPTVTTLGLRRARWTEGSALSRLARTLTPSDMLWADLLNRDLYKTGPLNRLADHLIGRRREWWVLTEPEGTRGRLGSGTYWLGNRFGAAVGIEIDPRSPWNRLRLLISPQLQDEGLATRLIRFGLGELTNAPDIPTEIEHPASDKATQTALSDLGFKPVYASIHMRLDFK